MSSMICPHCGSTLDIFGISKGDNISKKMEISFLGNLSWDPNLIELADRGRIEEYITHEFMIVTNNILGQLT